MPQRSLCARNARSGVVGVLANLTKHAVESGEHFLGSHKAFTVTEQQDLAGDECLLGVQGSCRDRNGGVIGLFHRNIFWVGWASAKGDMAVTDLKVVGDIAIWAIGYPLGDPNAVIMCQR